MPLAGGNELWRKPITLKCETLSLDAVSAPRRNMFQEKKNTASLRDIPDNFGQTNEGGRSVRLWDVHGRRAAASSSRPGHFSPCNLLESNRARSGTPRYPVDPSFASSCAVSYTAINSPALASQPSHPAPALLAPFAPSHGPDVEKHRLEQQRPGVRDPSLYHSTGALSTSALTGYRGPPEQSLYSSYGSASSLSPLSLSHTHMQTPQPSRSRCFRAMLVATIRMRLPSLTALPPSPSSLRG